jgi:hypothetical protein
MQRIQVGASAEQRTSEASETVKFEGSGRALNRFVAAPAPFCRTGSLTFFYFNTGLGLLCRYFSASLA